MTLPEILPMKLTDVGPEVAQRYIDDDDWVMSQKLDGARVMLRYDISETGERQFFWTNDGVKPLAFSAALLHLPMLNVELAEMVDKECITEMVLDGELIIETGVYHVFDLLHLVSWRDEDAPQRGMEYVSLDAVLEDRLDALVYVGETAHIKKAHVAYSREQKARLYAELEAGNVEGAVSKLLTSLYVPISAKGGVHRTKEWVKHKFVKTADVVVTAVERKFDHKGMVTHGSAALAVNIEFDHTPWTDGKNWISGIDKDFLPSTRRAKYHYAPRTLLPVGNASLIGKELTIDVGSVVEIRYLYWTGEAVVQPAILRKRIDKPAKACDLEQFPEYTRKIVEVSL